MTVDSVVAQIPGLTPPPATRRDVVLVAGPGLAGATSVVVALQDRLAHHRVVEVGELAADDPPAAVVFVVSATAPVTESDCAVLDSVASDTDVVIGVVTKIDVHRTWRDVLDADRKLVAARADRYRDMPWVAVAAAPDLGPPVVDDLVDVLDEMLADDATHRRNDLRACENRLLTLNRGLDGAVANREARLAALRDRRAETLRRSRLDKSQRTIAARSRIQQARLQSSSFARARCASARSALQEHVAAVNRRGLGAVADEVRRWAAAVSDDVREEVTRQLAAIGEHVESAATPSVRVGAAPLRPRGAETRLMMLLGTGFGLGVALTLSRLFADLAPRWAVGGAVGGALAGLAVTLWVVGVRALLHDRAVLDRWIADVTTTLRTTMEEYVATRVLDAEAALARAAAERDARDGVGIDDVIARIDREIRDVDLQRARAVATRERQVPVIGKALVAVRAELDAAAPKKPRLSPSESFL